MTWIEVKGLEKEVILLVRKKKKSISEISNELSKSAPTISQAVGRMVSEGLVSREIEYAKDARYSKVSLIKESVRIKKTHQFYFISFFLCFTEILISTIISFLIVSTAFVLGTVAGVLPLFFYLIYNAYIAEDKITVEKQEKQESDSS